MSTLNSWIDSLLRQHLGPYLKNYDSSHLSVGLLSGKIELRDVELKHTRFPHLGIPLELHKGRLDLLEIKLPISTFGRGEVQVRVCGFSAMVELCYASGLSAEESMRRIEVERQTKMLNVEKQEMNTFAEGIQTSIFTQFFSSLTSSALMHVASSLTASFENIQVDLYLPRYLNCDELTRVRICCDALTLKNNPLKTTSTTTTSSQTTSSSSTKHKHVHSSNDYRHKLSDDMDDQTNILAKIIGLSGLRIDIHSYHYNPDLYGDTVIEQIMEANLQPTNGGALTNPLYITADISRTIQIKEHHHHTSKSKQNNNSNNNKHHHKYKRKHATGTSYQSNYHSTNYDTQQESSYQHHNHDTMEQIIDCKIKMEHVQFTVTSDQLLLVQDTLQCLQQQQQQLIIQMILIPIQTHYKLLFHLHHQMN